MSEGESYVDMKGVVAGYVRKVGKRCLSVGEVILHGNHSYKHTL